MSDVHFPGVPGRPLKPGRLVRLAMLARCNGNMTRAALQLSMRPDVYWRWLTVIERKEGAGAPHLPPRKRYPQRARKTTRTAKGRWTKGNPTP